MSDTVAWALTAILLVLAYAIAAASCRRDARKPPPQQPVTQKRTRR